MRDGFDPFPPQRFELNKGHVLFCFLCKPIWCICTHRRKQAGFQSRGACARGCMGLGGKHSLSLYPVLRLIHATTQILS